MLQKLRKKNVKFLKQNYPKNSNLHESVFRGSLVEVKIYMYLGFDMNELKECEFMPRNSFD